MTTIKKEIEMSGICLMDGKESTIRILPSEKKGIYFYLNNSKTSIKACPENVISTQNCTVLGSDDVHIRLVEHFMAACAFTNIDSLEVLVSSSELPILDGSALVWVEAFNNAGIQKTTLPAQVTFKEPLYFSSKKANIVLLPAEKFKISYCINFDHPDLENRWISWNAKDAPKQIYEARTFGYLKDLEKFQQAGLALGASLENTVGLTETGYTVELRSAYEPIKHKILDLIGDMNQYINPFRLNAHILAQDAGHSSHIEFTKVIYGYMERKI
ncbi:MAG: UDP-3-O-acyl-N-acetylglucosamine deacetylase [Candidatus Gastranaerophilales bacterium]|nr:UDP-3-O-acyl-N-acetylglucosamine deacetylase [Candidatus Gastranaerophilales bacterium]